MPRTTPGKDELGGGLHARPDGGMVSIGNLAVNQHLAVYLRQQPVWGHAVRYHESSRSESTQHGLLLSIPRPREDELTVALSRCHPEEARHARELPPKRRSRWVAGRLALARAMEHLARTESSGDLHQDCSAPILSTDRGAPALPAPFVGSVSHVKDFAVALVDRAEGVFVGVDVESLSPSRPGIEELVVTAAEKQHIDRLQPYLRWTAILLRFSLKEALLKAFSPWLGREIGMQEVSIDLPLPSNEPTTFQPVELEFHLRQAAPSPFEVDAYWAARGDYVFATALLEPAPGEDAQ